MDGPDSSARREALLVLGEIAGEAAHELRNALAVIAGSASLIRAAEPAARDAHVAKIERSTRIAQSVVDALMALARNESIRGDRFMMATAVIEARRDVSGAASYVDDIDAGIEIRGSEVLVSRMFRVLYENAIQAAGPRVPRIETVARLDGANVTIDVTDDGPGIAEPMRAALFEPLVTTKANGTGLGLALARRVARAHAGDIALVPSATGAHFQIRLAR